jgi:cellulose synthase/poly-beta-1,6-N-acetylglucosamine synthase-like glycosyltransferase
MIYFWSIAFFTLICYALLIIIFALAWKKLKIVEFDSTTLPSEKIFISVIIAVRNEACTIQQLINSLSNQSLSNKNFEVIIVNDHSTDTTHDSLINLTKKFENFQCLQLSNQKQGKKEAISLALQHAKGELLAFTDGDCIPGENWLQSLSTFYLANQKPDLIIGLVDMMAHSHLEHIFRLDFLSLILSSSGAAIAGHPIFCNGANLAVKSSEFKAFTPNYAISSGDDVFLLHYLKKNNKKIKVLKSTENIVHTNSPKTFVEFLEQRKRWASKAKLYTDKDSIVVSLIVFLTNTLLIAMLILSIAFSHYLFLSIAFLSKLLSDAFLFWNGKDLFHYKGKFFFLPLISILYPFYIASTSLLALSIPFKWKDRKLNR